MTTNVLVAFYSTYGHIHRMALAEGAEGVPDTTVRLRLGDAHPLWQHERADEAVHRHHGWTLAQRRTRGQGHRDFHEHSRQPVEAELTTARNLGSRLARVA